MGNDLLVQATGQSKEGMAMMDSVCRGFLVAPRGVSVILLAALCVLALPAASRAIDADPWEKFEIACVTRKTVPSFFDPESFAVNCNKITKDLHEAIRKNGVKACAVEGASATDVTACIEKIRSSKITIMEIGGLSQLSIDAAGTNTGFSRVSVGCIKDSSNFDVCFVKLDFDSNNIHMEEILDRYGEAVCEVITANTPNNYVRINIEKLNESQKMKLVNMFGEQEFLDFYFSKEGTLARVVRFYGGQPKK